MLTTHKQQNGTVSDPADVIESGLDIYLSPVYTTNSFYYQSFAWAWWFFCSYAVKVSLLQLRGQGQLCATMYVVKVSLVKFSLVQNCSQGQFSPAAQSRSVSWNRAVKLSLFEVSLMQQHGQGQICAAMQSRSAFCSYAIKVNVVPLYMSCCTVYMHHFY